MDLEILLRSRIKAARRRGVRWVRLLDLARIVAAPGGLALLWTRIVHRDEIHQTTPYTREERYPTLFDLAARLAPGAGRILSFGCSTGEELLALRRRFPGAKIIGAEINPRSRQLAKRRVLDDPHTAVVHPRSVKGTFDIIFALAVLQREPHRITEMEIEDLSSHYPFDRFDSAVQELASRLRGRSLFCLFNAQYRFEDSSVAAQFEPVITSPQMDGPLFGPSGRRLENAVAYSIFRKLRQ